jgi:AcrR family transcriptional regulator
MTYHHGNLREALLDAATDLLVQEGAQKLSLRAAARQAGVSQSAPYRHFPAKGDLLAAVGQRGFKGLREQMVQELEGIKDHRARLHAGGRAYVAFAQQNPHLFRLMFGPLMSAECRHQGLHLHCRECFAVLMEVISEGQAAGIFKSGNPEVLANTAWTMVHGVAHLAIDGQLDPERFGNVTNMLEMLGNHLIDGLKA